ncbi:MAG: ABC transporter substrate-binding protein [Lentisphaerota bacterium]
MKKLTVFGASILSAALLFGVEAKAEKANINIFQFKVEIADAFNDLANEYMKENPGVQINIETVGGGSDYGAALRAKMASGNEPEIFNVGGPQDVSDWKDKLADLSGVPVMKDAFPGTLSGVTLDGKVYGIPFDQEGYGFMYNKAIFEKAGINAADINSFDKLEAAVKILDSKKSELGLKAVFAVPGKETWVLGLHFSNVGLANEFANVFDAYNAKTVAFKYSDGMKKLFDLQIKYAKKPVNSVDYSTQVEQLFSLEKVAIMQQGNWTLGAIKGVNPDLATRIAFLPMPIVGGKEDCIPVGTPMYWTVNASKNQKTQDASKAFLNWMYSSDKGKDAIVNKFGFIPPFKGYDSESLQPKDPLAKSIMEFVKAGKTISWVFMGYPTGWGMEIIGVDLQNYIDGKITWDKLVAHDKKSWADSRK